MFSSLFPLTQHLTVLQRAAVNDITTFKAHFFASFAANITFFNFKTGKQHLMLADSFEHLHFNVPFCAALFCQISVTFRKIKSALFISTAKQTNQ